MTDSQTIAAARALTSLVDAADAFAQRCDTLDWPMRAGRIREIRTTLDAARTRLVEDGPNYIDAAWGFVDAGRRQLASHRASIERAERRRAAAAEAARAEARAEDAEAMA